MASPAGAGEWRGVRGGGGGWLSEAPLQKRTSERSPGGGRHLTEFSRPQLAWEGILREERGPWTDGGSEPRGARWRGRRTSNRRLCEVSVRLAVLQPEPPGHLPGTGDAAGGPERGRGRWGRGTDAGRMRAGHCGAGVGDI